MKTTIGAYKVTRRLPGAGEAYVARSGKGKRCLVRLFAASEEGWEQAKRETTVAATLNHPSIVKVSEAFEEDGAFVVVFPHPEGTDLADICGRLERAGKTLEPAAVWYVAHQLAAALAQAHSACDEEGDMLAICHGNLSPQSVLIGWEGQVMLTGLGLASLLGGDGATGSDGFQAPEQKGGGRVTPRGDIYAVAAMVWHLLSGKEPSEALAVDELGDKVPDAFREPFSRALEPSLGKRRITSMELEGWFADLATEEGKAALVEAASVIKRGGTMLGAPRPPGAPLARTAPRPLSALTPSKGLKPLGGTPIKKPPPLRSKQATLLGSPSPDYEGGDLPEDEAPADGGDLKNLEHTVAMVGGMDIADELSWGGGASEVAGAAADIVAAGRTADTSAAKAGDDASEADEDDEDFAATVAFDQQLDALELPDTEDAVATVAIDGKLAESLSDLNPLSEAATIAIDTAHLGLPSEESSASGLAGLADDDEMSRPPSTPGRDAPMRSAPPRVASEAPAARSLPPAKASQPPSEAPGPLSTPPSEAPGPRSAPPSEAPAPFSTPPSALPEASPWNSPSSPPKPAKKLSMGKAVLVTIVTAVLVMGVGIWWTRRGMDVDVGSDPPAGSAKPTSSAVRNLLAPSSTASAAKSAAPSASASSSAAPSASALEVPPPGQEGDGSELPTNLGYLKVNFNGEQGGEVYVHGKSYGPVGQLLRVPCDRPGYVRIGKMPGPRWLSQGKPVTIKCQATTTTGFSPKF